MRKKQLSKFQENFGKSVRKHGTGDLIQCLRRKAESADNADFIELNAYRCRLSQFNHVDGSYIRKRSSSAGPGSVIPLFSEMRTVPF